MNIGRMFRRAALTLSVSVAGVQLACAQGTRDIDQSQRAGVSTECNSNATRCGDACVDVSIDAANCGSCGNACEQGRSCLAGQCRVGCWGSEVDCNGVCADLGGDPKNCGACGNACPASHSCDQGQCVSHCPESTTECGSTCVDTSSNVANCGACGFICGAGEQCSDGACVAGCSGTLTACNGECRDTLSDSENCGECGKECEQGVACTDGKCDVPCAQGLELCAGKCADLTQDPAHCGACGNACTGGTGCNAGSCTTACDNGRTVCSGMCVDLTSDPTHCGACGQSCGGSQSCTAGACTACNPATNIATSATAQSKAQAGEEQYGFGPSRMNDGKGFLDCPTHFWHWLGVAHGALGHTTYTWSSPKTVARIEVETNNACSDTAVAMASATVQWWDGSKWVNAGTIGGSGAIKTFVFPSPVTTTQIRLYAVKPVVFERAAVIYEWKVFSC